MNTQQAKPEKPLIFTTALLPEQSPYSLQSNPSVKIAHNGIEFVPTTDVIMEVETDTASPNFGKKVSRRIRFIDSFNSIYEDEQLKRGGYSSNYGKLLSGADRRSRADVILIERGAIEVTESMKPNKVEYLMKCNYNGANPNRKTDVRILFYLSDPIGKAEKEFDESEVIDKARSLILTLKGNYRKIQEIADVFNLDRNDTEKMLLLSLRKLAEKEPQKVIDAIADDKASVDFIAHKALELEIITFTGVSYKFTATDEKIISWQGRANDQKAFKNLVRHLESNDGMADLAQLTSLIEGKQVEAASEINS